MKNIHIREARASDSSYLTSLMDQLGYPIEHQEMNKNIQRFFVLPHHQAWVAEDKGEVIGCIAVAVTHYFHREGAFLRVITMVVNEMHRRSGIGKNLMQKAEEYAKKLNCTHVELTSGVHREEMGSHDFYSSQGYRDVNEQKKYFTKKL